MNKTTEAALIAIGLLAVLATAAIGYPQSALAHDDDDDEETKVKYNVNKPIFV